MDYYTLYVDKHPNKNSDSPFIKEEGEDFQSC